MARTTLTEAQRLQLLEWLAAGVPGAGIQLQFAERGWPVPSDKLLSYYRSTYVPEIAARQAARVDGALTRGLACKEARVAALVAEAEALYTIRWVPDKAGRLWNEKAYRETLADIAAEVGGRAAQVDLHVLIDAEAERLAALLNLPKQDILAEFAALPGVGH